MPFGRSGRDPMPNLQPAGKVFDTPAEGVAGNLRYSEPPRTPDHVKPFRNTYRMQVGFSAPHWGKRNDPPLPEKRFGIHGQYGESVASCLQPAPCTDGRSIIAAEDAERKYRRNRMEPLGKSAQPLNPVPSKCYKPNFAFGISSDKSESTKSLIYTCADREETAKDMRAPGIQKCRNYNWAHVGLDPSKFRFGCQTTTSENTAKELFTMPVVTRVVPMKYEEHARVSNSVLGQTKNLGFGSRPQGKDFTYGKTPKLDDLGTRALLSGGGYKPDPTDPTLGHPHCKSATLRRIRSEEPPADPKRIFGCPTVRWDLHRPRYKKVTNTNNYGDEANAGCLLYPDAYATDDTAFMQPYELPQLKDILTKSGYGLSDADTEAVFNTVAKGGKATLQDFRTAVSSMGL